jgi:hypothetical protein
MLSTERKDTICDRKRSSENAPGSNGGFIYWSSVGHIYDIRDMYE